MQSDLKSKLPHIYHHFVKDQQTLKSKLEEGTPDFAKAWNALIAQEEQIVKTVIIFIKLIDAKILKKEFVKELHEAGKVVFNFPPTLVKLIHDPTMFEAIFEDIMLQNRRVFDRHKVTEVLPYEWDLDTSGAAPHMILKVGGIKDPLLITTGIKEYAAAKEAKKAKPAHAVQPQGMSPEEKFRKFANELFESFRIFEKEILQVSTKSEKSFLMRQIFKEIVFNSEAKYKLNFAHLDSYDNLKISSVHHYIVQLLREEAEYFLHNIPNMPKDIAQEVLHSQKSDEFLTSLAKSYEEKYGEMLHEIVADSFLECAATAETMTSIPGIIQQAINGTNNYKPILEITRGNSVATKADQVWMRVKQAKLQRDKVLAEEQKNVDYYQKKVDGMKKNIVAIRTAFKLTVGALKKYTPQMLVDIALNEEGQYTEEKRVLQFAPKGDIALYLIEQADRGRRGAKTAMQKEDGKKALKFYENLNVNNTENVLKEKMRQYNTELPEYEEKLNKALDRLEELEDQGLEAYDDMLRGIKQAVMENLCVKRTR